MKKFIPITLIIVLFLYFYVFNGINFEIINNSGNLINNVKFYTSEKLEVVTFDKINYNENRKGFLNMRKNKIDGHYALEYIQNGKIEKIETGYYTNGGALNDKVIFQIEKDTVLVQLK